MTVRTSSHPLAAIAFFRRWPYSIWRDVVYTAIWNAMAALVLLAAGAMLHPGRTTVLSDFWDTLLISNVVGYLVHAAMVSGDRLLGVWAGRAGGVPRLLYYLVLVTLCVVVGIALGTAILRGHNPLHYLARSATLAPLLPFAVFVALLMFVLLVTGERRAATDTLAARQAEQIASAGQLLAEARLRALQAQIEPHFLYNTLANVVGMIETEPVQARRMLERFIDYLRASLAASRADNATLGAELAMAGAYLDVLAVRMGARLRYRFDIGDGCRELPIAPMLLQPVIENAVTHGLEPKIEGGEIVVRAQCQNARLCVEVSDTGAGLAGSASGASPVTTPKPGGGVGLANLRARLRSLYGADAQVQLIENQPCGITVRLLLPLPEILPSTPPAP